MQNGTAGSCCRGTVEGSAVDVARALADLVVTAVGTLVSMRPSAQDVEAIRSSLDALRASSDAHDEAVLETGLPYVAGQQVCIYVRKRHGRYDLTDGAAAVNLAGRPDGWLATAADTAAGVGMNVNRRGVVFVTGFGRRDLADLVMRLAECSRLVYVSLLESTD
jgi:hypothetical protein